MQLFRTERRGIFSAKVKTARLPTMDFGALGVREIHARCPRNSRASIRRFLSIDYRRRFSPGFLPVFAELFGLYLKFRGPRRIESGARHARFLDDGIKWTSRDDR